MHKLKALILIVIIIGINHEAISQFSSCPGKLGGSVFLETFGSGNTNGPALDASETSYVFVDQAPTEGEYTISTSTNQLFEWHNTDDNTGNQDGRALLINAGANPSLLYQQTLTGLCELTSYEFSAYLMNLFNPVVFSCPSGNDDLPVNVRFQIWDATETTLIAEADTGDLESLNKPEWIRFSILFTTLQDQTSVVIKMLNNGPSGCGNDLAIDDFGLFHCGDRVVVLDQFDNDFYNLCDNETLPEPLVLTAEPDFSVYASHFYQWQISDDNQTWTDIDGASGDEYIVDEFNEVSYRAIVAEFPENLENPNCYVESEIYQLNSVSPIPPVSLGDVEICASAETGTVAVEENENITVDWYDEPVDGNLLQQDSYTYTTDQIGTYYAESTTVSDGCVSNTRVAVSLSIFDVQDFEDQNVIRCVDGDITLSAPDNKDNYEWENGENTQEITVSQDGEFDVTFTNEEGCFETQKFIVTSVEPPVIEDVTSVDYDIVVQTVAEGDFSYSLDGINFQDSPVFEGAEPGLYNVTVSQNNGCGEDVFSFLHLIIPEYFTPNQDGVNDFFTIKDIAFAEDFTFTIYDRYGKLLFLAQNQSFKWDGTLNGKSLPSNDYWYKLEINNQIFRGHFTLKR